MNRCPLCPGQNTCVRPDGPPQCELVFIGEAPGSLEDKKDRPFMGKTGEEVNRHYLPLAGLRRENVYFTNAIRCLPTSTGGKIDLKREKDLALLQSCAEHFLYPDLRRMKPRVIITLGAFAARAIDPDINLEFQHGFPLETSWGTVFPQYHPAQGIHEPKKMLMIRNDWIRLKRYLAGKLDIAVDENAGIECYEALGHPYQVHDQLRAEWANPMACDTEITRNRDPFCLTFSVQPGTGYLIRAEDTASLEAFQFHLDEWEGPIIFHNWLFDGAVVEKMGLRFPFKKVRDTMVRAYHLGNLPQGLKALAYRELGMTMKDFDDVVKPHSTKRVIDYYRDAYAEDWPKPDEELVRDKDGKLRLYKPQSMNTKLKRFFSDWAKNPEKDVFDAWGNWEDQHETVENVCGPWPGKCISHVPFEEVIDYACLSGDSKVLTETGYRSIGDLVKAKSKIKVASYDQKTKQVSYERIIGWHCNHYTEKVKWMSIETSSSRSGRWSRSGTRYTPDHRILTPNGWREIQHIEVGDSICLPIKDLDDIQKQVAYGSLLGDGTISKRNEGGWSTLRYSHNIRQEEYALWKWAMLDTIQGSSGSNPPSTKNRVDGRPIKSKEHLYFSTSSHPFLGLLRKDSYKQKGKKSVSGWVEDLTELGLAVWYQDDGTRVTTGDSSCARLYTLSFTLDEIVYLEDVLKRKFGLDSSHIETRPDQWAIAISSYSADAFFETISSWIHPCMDYKLPSVWRDKFQGSSVTFPEPGLYVDQVTRVYSNPLNRRGSLLRSYCIDVQNTHNFFTLSEVAHNCRDADATLRLWPVLKHMRTQVRRRPQEQWRKEAA